MVTGLYQTNTIQCESIPLRFSDIFSNGWEFLINFLHAYYSYTFLSTIDYKFLFNCF